MGYYYKGSSGEVLIQVRNNQKNTNNLVVEFEESVNCGKYVEALELLGHNPELYSIIQRKINTLKKLHNGLLELLTTK